MRAFHAFHTVFEGLPTGQRIEPARPKTGRLLGLAAPAPASGFRALGKALQGCLNGVEE